MEGVNAAYSATGGEMESASELIGRAVRELSLVSGYDEDVEALESQLSEIDSLLSDLITRYQDIYHRLSLTRRPSMRHKSVWMR